MSTESSTLSEDNNSCKSAYDPATIDLVLLKREVDALQIVVHSQSTPWYRNISTLISVIALIFSFGTTYVSYVKAKNQDIQNLRVELRGLLQRLSALPKENVEMMKKYESDQASLISIGGFLNQENALLSRQAAEIARKIPSEYISATELSAIANALLYSYNIDGAKELFTKAIDVSEDMNDRITGLRNRANILFMTGQPEAGRVDYQRALNVFSEINSKYNDFTQKATHIQTEEAWAYAAANIGAKDEALQHLRNAENYVSSLPPGKETDRIRQGVLQEKAMISGDQPLPKAGEPLSQPMAPIKTFH